MYKILILSLVESKNHQVKENIRTSLVQPLAQSKVSSEITEILNSLLFCPVKSAIFFKDGMSQHPQTTCFPFSIPSEVVLFFFKFNWKLLISIYEQCSLVLPSSKSVKILQPCPGCNTPNKV